MEKDFSGLATGIGSFPHHEANSALEIIFQNLPEIPHWPQLPASGEDEGFIRQYLSPLLDRGLLKVSNSGTPFFDTEAEDWLSRLTSFYMEVLEGGAKEAEAFRFPVTSAAGFYAFLDKLRCEGAGAAVCLKGQLSGPVTVGLQLTDAKLQPAFYIDELRDIVVRSLSLQARWQAGALSSFGLPVILFIDDPSIMGYGQSTFVGLSRTAIQESLECIISAIHAEGALAGIHACAGVDWSLLFELPFDIVNIDVYQYFASLQVYTAELDEYLASGGTLAWGLVPTSDKVEHETAQSLFARLEEYFLALERKNVHAGRLRKQLLFTPSCGTGTLTLPQAEKVYSLLQELSRLYRK